MSAVGLLALSLLLMVLAAVFLVLGWGGTSESLVYVSIIASGGAAVCLGFAYAASRAEARRPLRRVPDDTPR